MAAALSQHSKGPEPAMITLFCNENFQESLPHLPPLMSLALALYPQYIIVVTAQRQTSLNYFLEWPPLYVVRGDLDGNGTPGHVFP